MRCVASFRNATGTAPQLELAPGRLADTASQLDTVTARFNELQPPSPSRCPSTTAEAEQAPAVMRRWQRIDQHGLVKRRL